MAGTPALVVFYGGAGASPIEQAVDRARLAAAYDAVEVARLAGIDRAILVTDDAAIRPDVSGLEVDFSQEPFRFGRRLAEVVREHELSSVIYMGAGSVPLLTSEGFADVVRRLEGGAAVTNNLFSSDLVAFPVSAAALDAVATAERDNSLARRLKDAGLAVESLPRSAAAIVDIDTPCDLAVLALARSGGPRLRDALSGLALDTSRYEATLPLFADRRAQILVAGRVGSHAWSYLERETACRVRLFAEERGMEADGRAESGAARSLLGFYIEATGVQGFFRALPELCDAAFIDTRVVLAHRRIDATREDRFLSDAGRWEPISDPFLRELTQKAAEAPLPVLLGGHSLVSGDLMVLNDYAWALSEAGPRDN